MNEVFIVRNASTEEIELKDFGLILSPSVDTELGEYDKASLSSELDAYLQSGNLIRIIDGSTTPYSEAYAISAPIYNLDVSYLNNSISDLETSVGWLQNNTLNVTSLYPYATNASVGLAIAPFATNASVGLALNPYATNASIGLAGFINSSALNPFATNASVGLAIAPFATNASVGLALAPFATNASIGLAGFLKTVDLGPYATNASVGLAIAPFATNASIGLAGFATNSSINTALGAYATNASINTAAFAKNASLGLYATNASVGLAIAPFATNASVGLALGAYTTNASVNLAFSNRDASLVAIRLVNTNQDTSIAGISSITSQFDVSNGILYVYDSSRGKWLSDKQALVCGRSTVSATGTVFFKNGDATQSSTTGFRMNRKGTLTGLSVQNNNVLTVARNVEVRVNNSTSYKIAGSVAVGQRGFSFANGNIDVSVGDILQVVATPASSGAALGEAIAVVEVTGRR